MADRRSADDDGPGPAASTTEGPAQDTVAPHSVAPDSGPQDGLAQPRRRAAVIAVSFGTMISVIDTGSLNIALPTLARELHVASSSVVVLVTVYQLVLLMTVLPFAAWGDRIGHRRLYQYGQVLYLVATGFCFVADSLPVLVAIRVAQALGAAATTSVIWAMMREIYPQSRMGRGMSLNTAIGTMASTLAPSLGGLILTQARWPWLFAVCVPIGLVSLIVGARALPDPVRRAQPYDTAGAVLCAGTFGLLVVGLEGAVHGFPPLLAAALLLAALAIGVVFVRHQSGQTAPVLPVDLLRNRTIALSSLAGLAGSVATMMVMITVPFRLQQQFGYSTAEAGLVYAAWPVTVMLFSPALGILSDRLRPGITGAVGTVVAIAGMAALAWLPDRPDHFDIMWRLALIAIGSGLLFVPNAQQVVFAAPIERAAAAGGLTRTTRMAGQMLGSTATAALLSIGVGAGPLPALIAMALFALSFLCCLVLLKAPRRARSRG
jgi:DHA2 family multidrug resistance protein-like MFS transporter